MKLDLKSNATEWITEASRLMGLAPMFAMMCAVLMLTMAVYSVQDLVASGQSERVSVSLPEFKLNKQPIGASLYEEYARVLGKLAPEVEVLAEKGGIRITISDRARFAEFMYVLNSIQGLSKDVIWHAEEICLASCGGKASQALVKGSTEKVEVKLRGESNE